MEGLLESRNTEMKKTQADLNEQISGFKSGMEILSQKLEDTLAKLNVISTHLLAPASSATPSGGIAGTPITEETAGLQADTVYKTAYADYVSGNYDLAVAGFKDFLHSFPQSDLADDALYWLGECYYAQKSYKAALDTFSQVVSQYPNGDRSRDAELKKGFCLIEMNQVAQGIIQLQHVVQTYPDTQQAFKARERLQELGTQKQ
jgi:tol-pal system protein YbgF